jgi:hypothetical protein
MNDSRVIRYFFEELAARGVVLLHGYSAARLRADIFASPLTAAGEINAVMRQLDQLAEQLRMRRFIAIFEDDRGAPVKLVARSADGLEELLGRLTGRTVWQITEISALVATEPAPTKSAAPKQDPERRYPHLARERAMEGPTAHPSQQRREYFLARGQKDPVYSVDQDKAALRTQAEPRPKPAMSGMVNGQEIPRQPCVLRRELLRAAGHLVDPVYGGPV